jgi:hypothetical protein
MTEVVSEIRTLASEGKLVVGPQNPEAFAALREGLADSLPGEYLEFLARFNGVCSSDGYFRIFGVGEQSDLDVVDWNGRNTWKDAWADAINDYWCFGETAWGDQYAFRRGCDDPTVYFLEAVSMAPEEIAPNFERFLTDEFLRNVRQPYDDNIRRAQQEIGPLASRDHITYVPSILITGSETESGIQKMPATASMIINGDMFRQLRHADRAVKRVDIQDDERGRPRAKIIWAMH